MKIGIASGSYKGYERFMHTSLSPGPPAPPSIVWVLPSPLQMTAVDFLGGMLMGWGPQTVVLAV